MFRRAYKVETVVGRRPYGLEGAFSSGFLRVRSVDGHLSPKNRNAREDIPAAATQTATGSAETLGGDGIR